MERESDAEGVAFVAITLSKDVMVIAFQDGDDDPDSPINSIKN